MRVKLSSQFRVIIGIGLLSILPTFADIWQSGDPVGTGGSTGRFVPFFSGETFDSYANGTQMHGLNDWKGWDGNPGAGALVTNAQANSIPHSVEILGSSDLVHEFSGLTSGMQYVRAMQYIPSSSTGLTYFILLNTYNDLGPYNWSVQVSFDLSSGLVTDDGSGAQLPLITDRWVEISVDIDLDNDTQSFYYDGQLLFSDSWTNHQSGGGVAEIAAIDLFANGASAVYYDDIWAGNSLPVPTLGTWGLGIFIVLLAGFAMILMRQRRSI